VNGIKGIKRFEESLNGTRKFELYKHKRNKYLKPSIDRHCIALQLRAFNSALVLSFPMENDRDENAALVDIKMVGSSTIGLGDFRQAVPAISV
jgi:hypothetical protein